MSGRPADRGKPCISGSFADVAQTPMTVMLMTRWLMLVSLVLGFALTFIAKGPGLLALGLVLGFVGLFGLIFALAAARVSASARPETLMAAPEDLVALRSRRPPVRPVPVASAAKNPAPPSQGALQ
jgi:hypothetical protein